MSTRGTVLFLEPAGSSFDLYSITTRIAAMKRLIFLLVALLPWLAFGQGEAPESSEGLSYPGYVFASSVTCTGANASWHYQCLPGEWKPFEAVADTDVIATCGSPVSQLKCLNTGLNRRWRMKGDLTDLTMVRICGVLQQNLQGCSKVYYLASGQPLPAPDPDDEEEEESPNETEAPEEPLTGLIFRNVTTAAVAMAPTVNTNFWAGLPDINRDGCPDAFIGTHSDASSTGSAMYMQLKSGSSCTGQFEYWAPDELRYTQRSTTPRISSRYMFGNWYGHPEGLWSFFGHDVDGNPGSARYILNAQVTRGSLPFFDDKEIGCPAAKMFCLPLSLFADGRLQLATRTRNYIAPGVGDIRDIDTGKVLLKPAFTLPYVNAHVVLDVEGDGIPEILVPALGGYLQLVDDALTWQPDRFTGTLPDPLAADNHFVPLDYDADGDMDLYAGYGTYSPLNADFVQHALHGPAAFYALLYRNNGDGSFTDVSSDSGIELGNRYYHSTYANTVAADLDLDGYPELVYGGECLVHNRTCTRVVLMENNGDGTFTVNRKNNFGTFASNDNAGGRPWVNYGDYDRDGRIDLIKTQGRISDSHNSLGLWRNVTDVQDNRWLIVTVAGAGVNTDGLGASIIVRDPATGDVITSAQVGAFSSGYQNLVPHLGVAYFERVDLDVQLPNGLGACHFDDVATNQRIAVSNTCVMTPE